MDSAEMRRRFSSAPLARLATSGPDGPHLVPVCFAVAGDLVYFAVDRKPKSGRPLKRLANIAADPRVSLLVDHYEDDWTRLWWVRADGRARVLDDPRSALSLLLDKYGQYRREPPPGPVVEIAVERWSGWSFR